MILGEIRWSDCDRRTILDGAELEELLGELDSRIVGDKWALVEVRCTKGGTIRIGLGDPHRSFLSYIPESGEPPYYHSVGDLEASVIIMYSCYGEPTELPGR